MKALQYVKDNPVVSVLSAFILLMTTVTGTLTATGQLDALVVTETELQPLADQVEQNKLWNQCHRLELRIERYEDRLWDVQRQDSPDEDQIRELENLIDDLEDEFDAKNCTEILNA